MAEQRCCPIIAGTGYLSPSTPPLLLLPATAAIATAAPPLPPPPQVPEYLQRHRLLPANRPASATELADARLIEKMKLEAKQVSHDDAVDGAGDEDIMTQQGPAHTCMHVPAQHRR